MLEQLGLGCWPYIILKHAYITCDTCLYDLVLEALGLSHWSYDIVSIVKFCMVVQYYIDPKILLRLICFLVNFVVSLFKF